MSGHLALSLLLILPIAASPFIYLLGRVGFRLNRRNFAKWLALIILLVTCIPLYFSGKTLLDQNSVEIQVYQMAFRMDGISLIMATVVLGLGIFVTLFSFSYMKDEEGEEKFYALLTTLIGTIIGLSCTSDLFNLWVWFETMAVSSYMLVAFYRDQPASLEAGVKYLVQSTVGSVLVILGISLVFAQTGTLNLAEIKIASSPSPLLITAGALFMIGFGVKSALVPMHTWLPDAHSQAPSGISAMLSGIVIEAGLIAMLRSLGPIFSSSNAWGNLLMAFGAANMLLGNLMALRQNQIKRLLAYSSISHMGYILAGLGIAVTFQQTNGAAGSFFHLIVHAMMKGLAFLAAGTLVYTLHLASGSHDPLTRDDLCGASSKYPLVAFTFSLALLSLGGLPPLAGFMSKWQILVSGFQAKNPTALVLVIFIALNSVLSLGYYAPLVNRIYRNTPSAAVQAGRPVTFWMALPLVCLSIAIIVLGIYPALISEVVNPAAVTLLDLFGR